MTCGDFTFLMFEMQSLIPFRFVEHICESNSQHLVEIGRQARY